MADSKDLQGSHEVYIVDLVTLEKLQLQYMPLGLMYNPESNFVAIESMGRNNPLYHFTGSEDTLTFDITFTCKNENRQDVLARVKWLEALSKADGYEGEPHEIKFLFGDMFSSAVWLMMSPQVDYRLFHKAFGLMPTLAYVSLTLKRVTKDNMTRQRILDITS